MGVFTALLDTNVLWPSLLRDFLLSLAVEGLYRPVWSEAILEELHDCEVTKLTRRGVEPAEARARAAQLIEQMRTHFDDAVVAGWEGLDGTYGLPDPDDEHVLAAAVLGGAGAIVTWNTKDFPDACLPVGIRALRPPTFLYDTVSLDPRSAVRAVEEIAARSGAHGPPRTRDQLLDMLAARYRLDDVVACLRDAG